MLTFIDQEMAIIKLLSTAISKKFKTTRLLREAEHFFREIYRQHLNLEVTKSLNLQLDTTFMATN